MFNIVGRVVVSAKCVIFPRLRINVNNAYMRPGSPHPVPPKNCKLPPLLLGQCREIASLYYKVIFGCLVGMKYLRLSVVIFIIK